ncbi:twin-arginine translocase TatA/TatE family subunit [Actinomyces sp. zg-332]|uniref:twin-arginine translocase TatA/TatE family subunit n=1 Tax=Actinomyces sp. zg-332 TaxID=2708340 RepID=UPI0014204345|nr:twin-arginine translocase TatA/TatE family subunit [Actinomyces sp. zg-332]QPK94699.1 twin-arginine translocase TatA/TatE family subunit [Actinomyces sp. zg-332]
MSFLNDIGLPGIILIVLGALIIFGPKKLPELGSSIGKMIKEFKKSVSDISDSNEEKEKKENKEE